MDSAGNKQIKLNVPSKGKFTGLEKPINYHKKSVFDDELLVVVYFEENLNAESYLEFVQKELIPNLMNFCNGHTDFQTSLLIWTSKVCKMKLTDTGKT